MGKGGKERIVPFNQAAEQALRAWLKDRASADERRHEGTQHERRHDGTTDDAARRRRERAIRCS